MKSKKSVAVHIQSEVMFFSLEPLLKELKKYPYEVTILIERHDKEKDWAEMSSGTVKLMKSYGYNPKYTEDFSDRVFDLCLTPYTDGLIKAKIYLKYEYGTLNIKPSLTYIPAALSGFQGFLCQSSVTADILSAYGKTFPVDNLRFDGVKKQKRKSAKRKLLFAPTYNDAEEDELYSIIKELKKNYIVMIKSHHGTQYLEKNRIKRTRLEELADEYYPSTTKLTDLIMNADVCLFGNSSAIGEAIYAQVPCVIYTKDLDLFGLGKMKTTQRRLVDEGFPYAKNKNEIGAALEKALASENKKRLQELNKKFFPAEFKSGVKGYLEAIEFFLDSADGEDYCEMKRFLQEDQKREVAELDKGIKEYQKAVKDYETIVGKYRKGKLYKLADKIYKIEGKVFHG